MQEKPAITAFPIQDALQKRWSPRAFDNKPLPKEEVISMFEAARWAMSGYNDQPWRFIVAQQGDDHYDKAFSCVGAWNQQWAQLRLQQTAAQGSGPEVLHPVGG